MKIVAVISNEKSIFKPFELFGVTDDLSVLLCKCPFKGRLIRKLKRIKVMGYIGEEGLPFKRFDGSGIFSLKLPMLIKKLIKVKNLPVSTVAIVSGGNDSLINAIFENISDIFREFYIISTDYDYAIEQAERFMCDYGIAVHTDEPAELCDVEVFAGNDFCGLGRCLLNFNTVYEINHGYVLPVKVDSRAFAEALLYCGEITERQLADYPLTPGGLNYD